MRMGCVERGNMKLKKKGKEGNDWSEQDSDSMHSCSPPPHAKHTFIYL